MEENLTDEQNPTGEIPPGTPPVEPGDSEPPQPKKTGVQERIDQLTREKREAIEETARLRGQMEGMRMAQAATPPKVEKEAPPKTGPAPENYETDVEYQAALTKFITNQVMETVNESTQSRTQEDKYRERHAKIMEASKETPELLQIINDPTLRWTNEMLDAADGENFAKIYAHVGKNRAEFNRIMSLSPTQQIKEIGKIEARVTTPLPKPKKKTNAPNPTPGITPGVGSPGGEVDPNKKVQADNFATWEAERRANMGQK